MRKEDGLLNATQILTLANTNSNDRMSILRLMKEQTVIEKVSPAVDIPWRHSWVNFQHGRILCKHLKLEQELKPLIDYRLEVQRHDRSKTVEQFYNHITEVWRLPTFDYQRIDACYLEISSLFYDQRTSSADRGPKVRFENQPESHLSSVQSAERRNPQNQGRA